MTRDEQIRQASIDYQLSTDPRAIGGDAFADMAREMNVNPSFIAGAKWMEKQMIEKACKVYRKEIRRLWKILSESIINKTSVTIYMVEFVQDFKKAMEE